MSPGNAGWSRKLETAAADWPRGCAATLENRCKLPFVGSSLADHFLHHKHDSSRAADAIVIHKMKSRVSDWPWESGALNSLDIGN